MTNKLDSIGKSSTGMNENVAALVSVLFTWITGLILFFVETKSKFVKFHAIQSVIFFVGLLLVSGILGRLPLVGGLVTTITGLGGFAMWIVLLTKTYQGEWFEIPYVGEFAKQFANIDADEE